ncbi:hypothetical protein ACHHYP_04547 [Achlya hypogyna]|uniref:Tyrosine-protein kinase ephrin type A/B receptor-like domain-containing protein n=1 Tax=Achlya hypogyna TaxID=1202772 RepID=A0A1V9Z1A2_ACHHY|nr:hypothetical protein ACHHYP_04547 [Achlya hypogyna]
MIIGPNTTLDDIRTAFHCGPRKWIGRYNELYQQCTFKNTSDSVLVVNRTLDAGATFVTDHGPFAVHVELHMAVPTFTMTNATIVASAVHLTAANASLDEHSAVNTTAQGLRFGPGYNSYVSMGSSYGGMGGYTLAASSFSMPATCDDIDPDGAFAKPIGDLAGSPMDFRGYGSGGSEADRTRGGGCVSFNVSSTLALHGRLLADGGFDASSGGGAGGTIRLWAHTVVGVGVIHARGGAASALTGSDGGGGGGGGGRIAIDVTAPLPALDVAAFGGGLAANASAAAWCQVGGDGTILLRTGDEAVVWVRGPGGRQPVRRLVGTPVFLWTARHERMLQPWMQHVRVTGGALLLASTLLLDVEAGAAWTNVADNATLHGSAANVTIDVGYVGPLALRDTGLGRTFVTGGVVALRGATVEAARLVLAADAGAATVDAATTVRFEDSVSVTSMTDTELGGAIECTAGRRRETPTIEVRSGRDALVAWAPSLSLAAVVLTVHAQNASTLTLPFPLRRLHVTADRIAYAGGANGTASVFPHDNRDVCHPWPEAATCDADGFQLALVANSAVTVADVFASSVLLCGTSVTVGGGGVGGDGLGCKGDGPGASQLVDGASGGAGHGGRGGNVQPGDRGGGATCSAGWPGSGAAGPTTGGLGGGLILVRADALTVASRLSVRGGNGTGGGGGGAGGSLLLFLGDLTGNGHLEAAGGGGSSTNERHGGGGGGGFVRIEYAAHGSGAAFHGTIDVAGGPSAGQTGFDGIGEGRNCVAGCGGLLCAPCPAGQASPRANSTCAPCAMGTFAAQPGSITCTDCKPGTFNPTNGSTACFACAAGSVAPTPAAVACKPCPPGSFAPAKGGAKCTLCPVGSIAAAAGSAMCTLCDVGATTAAAGATRCQQCTAKPPHASYNQNGTCHYMCEKGRVGLSCLTPFEQFVAPIGGPVGFVLLCLGSVGLVFAGYAMLTTRAPARRLKQYRAQELRADVLKHQRRPRARLEHMSDPQLPFHVARLYLDGTNSWRDPWRLSPVLVVDARLRRALYEGSFAAFATKASALLAARAAAWRIVGGIVDALALALPPAASIVRRLFRRGSVLALRAYLAEHGAGFFRDLDVRAHGATLVLGFSEDLLLGYVDVLLSPDAQAHLGVAPAAPLVLALAGDGSFVHPWHVDTNDALVRSVPSRLQVLRDAGWLELVAAVNAALRLATSASLGPVLDVVHRFNAADDLNGYTVALVGLDLRAPTGTYFDCVRPIDDTDLAPGEKLALVVRRPDDPPPSPPPVPSVPPPLPPVSSIRYEALFAPVAVEEPPAEGYGLLTDGPVAPRPSPLWQALRRAVAPAHVPPTPAMARFPWVRPLALLALLVTDVLLWLGIALQFFCIQVGDPTVHEAGCSHTAFALVLAVLPGAVVGTPLLGLFFVFRKQSSLGRQFVLWTTASYVNVGVAVGCAVGYSAYVGDAVLALAVAAGGVKWLERRWATQLLAQFEADRVVRGWAGLFTTLDYYDSASRPLGRWPAD